MNLNSEAIKIFCCPLGGGASRLSIKEWSYLCSLIPNGEGYSSLLEFSLNDYTQILGLPREFAERLVKLADRAEAVDYELSEYENAGVYCITREDNLFPQKLIKTLGDKCPPVLFYSGDICGLTGKFAGFVGARNANARDEEFTRAIVRKTAEKGFGVVSGGARGVDTFAETEAFKIGSAVVEFPAEGILRRMRSEAVERALYSGALTLLSPFAPDSVFDGISALTRNRYIYALSEGTVAVKADLNKGGTRSGVLDNLKHGWCNQFCWNNAEYAGNRALIARGAIPIDESFNGNVSSCGGTEQTRMQ